MNSIWQQPLPAAGTTTVLEASAGTGKSFTIAGMIARQVCEGVPLENILAVTFSRRATAELRDSILRRLVSSRAALKAVLDGNEQVASEFDVVDQVIASGSPAELEIRLERVKNAVLEMDRATMVTLHTFASRMLDELGVLADHDAGIRLVEEPTQLIHEVIIDTYLSSPRWQELDWLTAQSIGVMACNNPETELRKGKYSGKLRGDFVEELRARYQARKTAGRLLTYDDLITRLSRTLTEPKTGEYACQVLADRFPVVMVDEFQDTDPQQWTILSRAFQSRSALTLIGDPKQAIYRFRGGDIETYGLARSSADSVFSLTTNYRSDKSLCDGISGLFGTADLGVVGASAVVSEITAHQKSPRIKGPRIGSEQVEIRALDLANLDNSVATVRPLITNDLLTVVDELLTGDQEIFDSRWRPVANSDIAILVSKNDTGKELAKALTDHGHLAVFVGDSSVFDTAAARDLLTWLEGMESPDLWHLRKAMLTRLVGWNSADIASGDQAALEELTAVMAQCSKALATRGLIAALGVMAEQTHTTSRLLKTKGGEEYLSDLNQLTELLGGVQRANRWATSELITYLREQLREEKASAKQRIRRLPTDRSAITVMTIHQSKGLQFPIVLLPSSWDRKVAYKDKGKPMIGHDAGHRVLDIATPNERAANHHRLREEDDADSLRLFYVACTRARSLLITWWAETANTPSSPLHRLLRSRIQDGTAVPSGAIPGSQKNCPASALPMVPGVKLRIIKPSLRPPEPIISEIDSPNNPLVARTFIDSIDRHWSRTSYSALTADAHEFTVLEDSDEPELAGDAAGADIQVQESDRASRLAELPGGVGFGSVVHSVLEIVDPASASLRDDLLAAAADQTARWGVTANLSDLVAGLEQSVTTPLGKLTDGVSLAHLGAKNRLAELDFELPLGTTGRSVVADLAAVMSRWLAPNALLADYPRKLSESTAADRVLAGFLTGSIDVVLQVPGKQDRYVVIDYKTNRAVTTPGEPLLAASYSPKTMAKMMMDAHYPLQALLYSVALHRYLKWRIPSYDPHTHLGGVGYLFVRGMTGPENLEIAGMGTGVFTWFPAAEMIIEASEVLAGGQS